MSKRQVIGITGRKGNGKDTAAQALEGFEIVKFAGALKEMVRAYMRYVGVSEETIERCVEGDMKETKMALWGGKTTRYVLQTLGTDWGRNMIWDKLWTNAFQLRSAQFQKVACTDMRFPNESDVIAEEGGTTLRVTDPRKPVVLGEHPSEDLIDTLDVDYEIVNDGSIEDLHNKMRALFVSDR